MSLIGLKIGSLIRFDQSLGVKGEKSILQNCWSQLLVQSEPILYNILHVVLVVSTLATHICLANVRLH